MVHAVYLVIIMIMFFVIGTLLDMLQEEVDSNKRFYRNLRIDYDIRIKRLQDENDDLRARLGGYYNG